MPSGLSLTRRHGLAPAAPTGRRRPRQHDGPLIATGDIRWRSDALESTAGMARLSAWPSRSTVRRDVLAGLAILNREQR